MFGETVCIGYFCPGCGHRVAVLHSGDPPPEDYVIVSRCDCGFARPIQFSEITSLNVWREEIA